MSQTITKKSHPDQWAIIKRAFPDYRKRTARWVQTESVTLFGRYWDEGSKSYYKIVSTNNNVSVVPCRHDYPFMAPDEVVELTPETMVVQCGIFCGKKGTAYLYTEVKDESEQAS
jgi:hypothetical protein